MVDAYFRRESGKLISQTTSTNPTNLTIINSQFYQSDQQLHFYPFIQFFYTSEDLFDTILRQFIVSEQKTNINMREIIVWILLSALSLQISFASNMDDGSSMRTRDTKGFGIKAPSFTNTTSKPVVKHKESIDSVQNKRNETSLIVTESVRLGRQYESIREKKRRERNRKRYRTNGRQGKRDWSKYARVHVFCSAYNDMEVFKNYRFKGGARTWKTYYHKRFAMKKGDIIIVKVVTDHDHHYGGICSAQVETPGGFEFFSTGKSERWTVSKGYKFGTGDDELEKLVDEKYKPERWVKPEIVKGMSPKCPSYPYDATKAEYVWEKESKKQDMIYLRYVHRYVQKKASAGRDECECIPLPRTMSLCYYWTDEAQKLCKSKECGQKYKCVGPAKRGAMNCIGKPVDSVVVPKYPGASECEYEKAAEGNRHVVPYDFPEGPIEEHTKGTK